LSPNEVKALYELHGSEVMEPSKTYTAIRNETATATSVPTASRSTFITRAASALADSIVSAWQQGNTFISSAATATASAVATGIKSATRTASAVWDSVSTGSRLTSLIRNESGEFGSSVSATAQRAVQRLSSALATSSAAATRAIDITRSAVSTAVSSVRGLISYFFEGIIFNDLGFNNYRSTQTASTEYESSAVPWYYQFYAVLASVIATSSAAATRALDITRSAVSDATSSAIAFMYAVYASTKYAVVTATSSATALRSLALTRAGEMTYYALCLGARVKEHVRTATGTFTHSIYSAFVESGGFFLRVAEVGWDTSVSVWKGITIYADTIFDTSASAILQWVIKFHLLIEGFTAKYASIRGTLYEYFKIRGMTKRYAKLKDALYGGRK